ncbi:MAG TPA: hypothetical protein VFP84_40900 [Kofleriaceae bacterium]|nr:hypothetical protein [Kofleriaceae bacterium]
MSRMGHRRRAGLMLASVLVGPRLASAQPAPEGVIDVAPVATAPLVPAPAEAPVPAPSAASAAAAGTAPISPPTPAPPSALEPAPAALRPAPRLRPVLTDRGWQLDLTGYFQADLIAYNQLSVDEVAPDNPGQPLNQERFVIPRARIRAVAHDDRDGLFGLVELDGNTRSGAAIARLIGAQVGWTSAPGPRPDAGDQGFAITASAGLMTIPFGVEVPRDLRDNPFLEHPAVSRALFPGDYDLGALLQGRYGYARWSLAVMNGAPIADQQWQGKDPLSSYDFVGRLGADVPMPYALRLEAGVSALTGKSLHAGVPPTKDSFEWVDENLNGIIDPGELEIVRGSPGEPSQTYTHDALGLDARLRWIAGRLGAGEAFFEGALATNLDRGLVFADPVAASRDLRQLGYQAGVVQSLGAHALLGVRYDRYDADRDATDRQGARLAAVHKIFSTWAVMASARWGDAKLIFEYDRNRNPFGRGDDGQPATRSADQFAIRGQVGF